MSAGSLCSGYEGFGLALGETPAWVADNDPDAARLLAHRFPDVPNLGDITTVDWHDVEPVDIVTAGYPCQPFSHAGKRKGSDDSRHIWPSVARAIGVLRPRRVLLENVAGHVSLGLADVLADLAALGYDATWGVIRAADAGAPHGRARVFIVATNARSERHGRGQDGRSVGRVDREDASETRQRERSRAIAGDRGAATVADTDREGLERRPALRCGADERALGSNRVDAATDAESDTGRLRNRNGDAATDAHVTSGEARSGRRGTGEPGRLQPVERGSETLADTGYGGSQWPTGERLSERRESALRSDVDWGEYAAAIRRWERTLGRPAARPTEPGRTAERLSPRFVEWMQGLPDGWVTDVPGLSRNAQLRLLGNGIVPQQARLAVDVLTALGAAA